LAGSTRFRSLDPQSSTTVDNEIVNIVVIR
jgi:hypothetical protein